MYEVVYSEDGMICSVNGNTDPEAIAEFKTWLAGPAAPAEPVAEPLVPEPQPALSVPVDEPVFVPEPIFTFKYDDFGNFICYDEAGSIYSVNEDDSIETVSDYIVSLLPGEPAYEAAGIEIEVLPVEEPVVVEEVAAIEAPVVPEGALEVPVEEIVEQPEAPKEPEELEGYVTADITHVGACPNCGAEIVYFAQGMIYSPTV